MKKEFVSDKNMFYYPAAAKKKTMNEALR